MPVGQLGMLGEVALGVGPRIAVQRHVQGDQPRAVEVAARVPPGWPARRGRPPAATPAGPAPARPTSHRPARLELPLRQGLLGLARREHAVPRRRRRARPCWSPRRRGRRPAGWRPLAGCPRGRVLRRPSRRRARAAWPRPGRRPPRAPEPSRPPLRGFFRRPRRPPRAPPRAASRAWRSISPAAVSAASRIVWTWLPALRGQRGVRTAGRAPRGAALRPRPPARAGARRPPRGHIRAGRSGSPCVRLPADRDPPRAS